jgi:uncharacterized protein (TIGR02996 family)
MLDDTESALLHDIRQHPGDNTPRLVYADWLADHGDEARGEMIRASCRGEQEAARRLLAQHEGRWRRSLPVLAGITWGPFTRGVVEEVTAENPFAFLRHAEALFRAQPVLGLRIRDASEGMEALAASPHLLSISELNLGNRSGLSSAGVASLASSPNVAHLTSLLLHQNRIGNSAIFAVALSGHLSGLRELYLSGSRAGQYGAAALARGRLAHLDLLDLRDNEMDNLAADLLAQWEGPGPVTLQLSNNRIGPPGGVALASSSGLGRLSALHLDHNPVGDEAVHALAASPDRAALRELDLRSCAVTDEGALALARSPLARQLRFLGLGGNPIRSSETFDTLAQAFGPHVHL